MAEQSRPLWEVMHAAHADAYMKGQHERAGYAAELRAIADAMERLDPPDSPASNIGFSEYPSGFDAGAEKMQSEVVRWLRAEACRAEAGEAE